MSNKIYYKHQDRVYSNCRLNCKGCYVKQDDLFKDHNLIHPDMIMDMIEEAVTRLGTKTIKYLGPSEFFRDPDIFKYLDRFAKLDVILGVFVKDPMFGDDNEVEELFGRIGIHSSEQLIKKLATYRNLRILFNFRSFDDEKTNDLVRGGYVGKADYQGNYKLVQTRALQLLYQYFTKAEIEKGRESRLIIINTPIISETIAEAFEIYTYFFDRGIPVLSTTSMQSGCGGKLYGDLDKNFLNDFQRYYAKAIAYSLKRGIISHEYLQKLGPSPYA
ncbi:MAG: radical SAM protein, partial [Candidatus Falkowbacteria bacterium]|nr:radical SAM protein [Candidatus Falkowbacteria bacterium]